MTKIYFFKEEQSYSRGQLIYAIHNTRCIAVPCTLMIMKTAKKSQKNTYFAQVLHLLVETLSLFLTHEMVDNSKQEYQPFTGKGAFLMKQSIEKTKNLQTL